MDEDNDSAIKFFLYISNKLSSDPSDPALLKDGKQKQENNEDPKHGG